jgi:outer membrane receptor protein involved in Fe transport
MLRVDIPPDLSVPVNAVLDSVNLETTPTSTVKVRLYGSPPDGVSKVFYETLLEFFRTKKDWESVTEDEESIDFFYDEASRTRKTFDLDGSYRLRHDKKRKVGEVNLSVSAHPDISRIRISHHRDIPVAKPQLLVTPTAVRRKSRKTFFFRGWSYSLTKVWQASNHSTVQRDFCTGSVPTSYEVDIERTKQDAPYSAIYLACSSLLKVQSVLKPFPVTFTKE